MQMEASFIQHINVVPHLKLIESVKDLHDQKKWGGMAPIPPENTTLMLQNTLVHVNVQYADTCVQYNKYDDDILCAH